MYASLKYAVGGFTALDSTNIDPCLMYASLTYAVGGFTVCGHRLALKRIVMTSIWPYHHQMAQKSSSVPAYFRKQNSDTLSTN